MFQPGGNTSTRSISLGVSTHSMTKLPLRITVASQPAFRTASRYLRRFSNSVMRRFDLWNLPNRSPISASVASWIPSGNTPSLVALGRRGGGSSPIGTVLTRLESASLRSCEFANRLPLFLLVHKVVHGQLALVQVLDVSLDVLEVHLVVEVSLHAVVVVEGDGEGDLIIFLHEFAGGLFVGPAGADAAHGGNLCQQLMGVSDQPLGGAVRGIFLDVEDD